MKDQRYILWQIIKINCDKLNKKEIVKKILKIYEKLDKLI